MTSHLSEKDMVDIIESPDLVSYELRQHLDTCQVCQNALDTQQKMHNMLYHLQVQPSNKNYAAILAKKLRQIPAAWLQDSVVYLAIGLLLIIGIYLITSGQQTGTDFWRMQSLKTTTEIQPNNRVLKTIATNISQVMHPLLSWLDAYIQLKLNSVTLIVFSMISLLFYYTIDRLIIRKKLELTFRQ
ncbi:MAG: hypothetical protein GF313_04625 [Caldithrix sp.]|nr:hypothetical protein [Caldithrix sp.]